jgi:hypothetical protein
MFWIADLVVSPIGRPPLAQREQPLDVVVDAL